MLKNSDLLHGHHNIALLAVVGVVTMAGMFMVYGGSSAVTGMAAGGQAQCRGLEMSFDLVMGCCDLDPTQPGYARLQDACDRISDSYANGGCGILDCGGPFFFYDGFEANAVGKDPVGWSIDEDDGEVTVVKSPVFAVRRAVKIQEFANVPGF